MNDLSDELLLQRWQQDDKPAGKELYRRYFPVVRRYFYNKAGVDECDDLVGATFLRCHQGLQTFRGEATFKTFILKVARNVFADHCRRRATQRKHLAGVTPSSDEVSARDLAKSPFSIVADGQQARLLLEGLRTLPLEIQELLELFYWEELSGSEVASVLEIPEGTVRGRLKSARRQLNERLQQLAGSPEELASTVSDLDGWARKIRAGMGRTPE